ncbi:MAG: hypothetical protein J6J97_04845 [Akkermansia sp.]|nr:hypothetical protein [Akkermansia sp.]MBQ8377354.1 hypothetical protein [Akkermansia sp.]
MKMPFRLVLLATASLGLSVLYAQELPEFSEDAVDTAFDGIPEYMPKADENRRPGEVPAMFRDDAMLDDSHSNQELGINVYTAPSISKIFAQLDNLPGIPEEYVLRNRPQHLPLDAGKLSLEMGYLLADGFIAVRSGHMNDIKPIALDLSRYGKAIGVGEKMNTYSASLLEHAEKGQLEEFKRILTTTQGAVNEELTALRDPDLAHLLALGGWVRALEAAAVAIEQRFDASQAAVIFYPDAPAYFNEILAGLHPRTARRLHVEKLSVLLEQLVSAMSLAPGEAPSPEKVRTIKETAAAISTIAVGEGYEH